MSAVVNDWLAENSDGLAMDQMKNLSDHVKKHFEELRRKGSSSQTPTTLARIWPDRYEWIEWPERERLSPAILALMERQCEEGEMFPYALHEGRLPKLSTLYVRQVLESVSVEEPTTGEVLDVRPAAGAEPSARPAPLAPPRSVEQVLRAEVERPLLVVAGPGGGKTTLTTLLAADLAQPWLHAQGMLATTSSQSQEMAPVPLWVAASDLADNKGGMEAALVAATGAMSADGALAGLLPQGVRARIGS
jgi:hypothetical protein